MWDIHEMECYLTTQRNNVLVYSIKWVDLENSMLLKKKKANLRRPYLVCFHLFEISIIESRFVAAQSWRARGECKVISNGYKILGAVMKMY